MFQNFDPAPFQCKVLLLLVELLIIKPLIINLTHKIAVCITCVNFKDLKTNILMSKFLFDNFDNSYFILVNTPIFYRIITYYM